MFILKSGLAPSVFSSKSDSEHATMWFFLHPHQGGEKPVKMVQVLSGEIRTLSCDCAAKVLVIGLLKKNHSSVFHGTIAIDFRICSRKAMFGSKINLQRLSILSKDWGELFPEGGRGNESGDLHVER